MILDTISMSTHEFLQKPSAPKMGGWPNSLNEENAQAGFVVKVEEEGYKFKQSLSWRAKPNTLHVTLSFNQMK